MEKATHPLFIDVETVMRLHAAQMQLFGEGPAALLNQGLLESAVVAPQHLWLYDNESDIYDLAASYCAHVAWNHAFEDGNKRVALSTALHFLSVNGLDLTQRDTYPEQFRVTDEFLAGAVLALVERSTTESSFAETLFLTVGIGHVTEALSGTREPLSELLKNTKFQSKEEAEAFITDAVMCTIVESLMSRCQKFFINPKRYRRLEAGIRDDVVSKVAPKYQVEFGMVVTDDPELGEEPS